jgi:uncharacterized membrane protein YbhN (UPF0104 family)
VAVLALGFCLRTVAGQWQEIRHAVATANPWLMVLGLAASIAGMSFLAVLWRAALLAFGERITLVRALAWYFAGELGKYLPGGVWQVVGRGELAVRGGVRRSVGYASTLISMFVMCISAAVVCGVLAPFLAADGNGFGWELALLLLVPIGILAVHPRVFGLVLELGNRLSRGRLKLEPPPWSDMLRLIVVGTPTWLLIGAASVAVTDALGYDQSPARIAFAAVTAWIVGFLAIPVPAGAGIRELVFVAVSGLELGPATAVAAVARVLLLLTDALGGVVGLAVSRNLTSEVAAAGDPASVSSGGQLEPPGQPGPALD